MNKAMVLAGVLVISAWSAVVQAQVGATGAAAAGNNDLLVSLYNQLEALQEEVQTLRGIVEEQSNRLRRLETETRDRYLDMDSRLSNLSSGAAVPGAAGLPAGATAPPAASGSLGTTGAVTSNTGVQGVGVRSPQAPAGAATATPQLPQVATGAAVVDSAANQMSEQDLYRSALNLLLEEGKSEESAAQFAVYMQRFPNGRLLPNALYWHGESLILLSRYPEAQAAFERVLNEFPGDAKAAGAMLKTGVVQNLLGNRSGAERIWRELPGRFPDSASEITLARDYLSRP